MRRRVQWHNRRSESFSDSALPPVPRSSASSHQRPWTDLSAGFGKSRDEPRGSASKTTIAELASYMRGWRGYFGFCETPEVLVYLTRWVRLRLRAALWRQGENPHRRPAGLLQPRSGEHTA